MMKVLEQRLATWVTERPWMAIVLAILIFGVALAGVGKLSVNMDYRIFFGDDNPQLKDFEYIESTYTRDDSIRILIKTDQTDVFNSRTLSAVSELSERAWQIPYSTRVDSITNFQYTYAVEDNLFVGDLVDSPAEKTPEELSQIKQIALSEPTILNRLLAPNAQITAINITLQLPNLDPLKETPEVMSYVRNMVAKAKESNSDLEIYISGSIALNMALTEAGQKDVQTLLPIVLLSILLLATLFLGRVIAFFLLVTVIILSVLSAFGAAGWMGFTIAPPVLNAPIIILTLAIASSVHILSSFYQELNRQGDAKPAMYESIKINALPVSLTALTTVIGFLAMNFSDSPPFRTLGNMVALGVIFNFVFSVTLLPALALKLPAKPKKRKPWLDAKMTQLGEWVIKYNQGLFIVMSLLITILVISATKNEMNESMTGYFSDSIPFKKALDFESDNLAGLYSINYAIDSGQDQGIYKAQFINSVEAFTEWLRQDPMVTHVNSYNDTLKRLNKNMHGDDPAYYDTPNDESLVAQYVLLYEMSLPFGLDLTNQINLDKSGTRLVVSFDAVSSAEIIQFEQRAKEWLADNMSKDYSVVGSSSILMFTHLNQRLTMSMINGTIIAFGIISLILMLSFKSIKLGLVSILPNILPAAVGFGVWAYFNGKIGSGLAPVAGMTIGIVVDDTVHFLSKYIRGRREHSLNSKEALVFAFEKVGPALIITTAVLVTGFSVLAFSVFKFNSEMGALTAIIMLIALIIDLLFLPTLLLKLDRNKIDKG